MDDPLGVHVNAGGEDPELAAIRAKRMAQLQGQAGMGGGGGMMPGGMNFPGMNGGMPQSAAEQQQQQEKQKAADEQRMQILKALLTPGARERLNNIAMVKKEKARHIEDMLITQAGRGAIQGVVEEEDLIAMLEQISEAETKRGVGKVTIQRRRFDDDDDW